MSSHRLLRLTVVFLVALPLTVSAIYMWAMWDPTKRVPHLPVALVNADRAVGTGDDRVDAGASVASTLVAKKVFDLRATSAADAREGLADGRYYFTITIPEDFSATLASIGDATVAPALITVAFNDNNNIKASSIGGAAMTRVTASVLEGVSRGTVRTLVDGVDSLGTGIRRAADGAERLRAGSAQLVSGAGSLNAGVSTQLVPGAARASDGATELAQGASTLSTGLDTFSRGTDRLGSGATQVADGVERLTKTARIAELRALLSDLQARIPAASQSPATAGVERILSLLADLERLRDGSREVADQLSDPGSAYRSGLTRIVDGGRRLDDGSARLATGLQDLRQGIDRVGEGASRLDDGAQRLDVGARTLSSSLAAGAEQVPDLGDPEKRATVASLASTPVKASTEHVARAQFFGPGAAPTILVIGSALVVILVLMSFRARRFVTGHDRRPVALVALGRRGLVVGAVSLVGMAVLGGAAWMFLSPAPSPASLSSVVIVSAIATVMNVAVFSVLFHSLGYIGGTLTSLAWLMVQLFSYGGVWMVQTVPTPFRLLQPLMPMTYVREAMIPAVNGTGSVVGGIAAMVLITAIAIGVVCAVVVVRRRVVFDPQGRAQA